MAFYNITTHYDKSILIDSNDEKIISILETMKATYNRSLQKFKIKETVYKKFIQLFDNGFIGDDTLDYGVYTFSSDDLGLSGLTLKEALKACKKPYRCPKTIDMFEKD